MSSDRITQKDVKDVFQTYTEVLTRYGLVTAGARLVLDIGSKTYGRAHRVHEVRDGSGGQYEPLIGRSFLGMTAAEAYGTLSERIRTVGDIAHVKGWSS